MSDPLCHPQILVPGLDSWGSLTPQMHVAVVRRNRARSVTSSGASLVSRAITASFPSVMNTPDRFWPDAAFN